MDNRDVKNTIRFRGHSIPWKSGANYEITVLRYIVEVLCYNPTTGQFKNDQFWRSPSVASRTSNRTTDIYVNYNTLTTTPRVYFAFPVAGATMTGGVDALTPFGNDWQPVYIYSMGVRPYYIDKSTNDIKQGPYYPIAENFSLIAPLLGYASNSSAFDVRDRKPSLTRSNPYSSNSVGGSFGMWGSPLFVALTASANLITVDDKASPRGGGPNAGDNNNNNDGVRLKQPNQIGRTNMNTRKGAGYDPVVYKGPFTGGPWGYGPSALESRRRLGTTAPTDKRNNNGGEARKGFGRLNGTDGFAWNEDTGFTGTNKRGKYTIVGTLSSYLKPEEGSAAGQQDRVDEYVFTYGGEDENRSVRATLQPGWKISVTDLDEDRSRSKAVGNNQGTIQDLINGGDATVPFRFKKNNQYSIKIQRVGTAPAGFYRVRF